MPKFFQLHTASVIIWSKKAVTAAVKASAAISAEPIKAGWGAMCKGSNF